jgi:hypothetical protein
LLNVKKEDGMGFLTVLIYIVLSLTVGSLLVSLSVDTLTINILSEYLQNNFLPDPYLRSGLFLVGVILILFCLRYIQASLWRSKKNKSISFESSQGRVNITLFAIEEMLKKILEAREEISHIRIKVFIRKKWLEVMIKGILTSEVNLIDFTKEVQDHITEKINTLLGEDKQVKVNLEIRRVSIGNKGSLKEDSEPEVPFRNYE